MRRHTGRCGAMLAGFALAAATGNAALAACNIDEAGLVERHDTLAAERGALTPEARQAFLSLRRTAEGLDRNGLGTACEGVVETALRLLEDPGVWTAASPPATDPDAGVGEMNLAGLAAVDRPVETAALIGRGVTSTAGTPLGVVDGVLLDQARDASHLVVTEGGFWGAGAREIAVPSRRVLIDPESGALFVDIGAAGLDEAPAYASAGQFDADSNDAWYDTRADEAQAAREAVALESRSAERAAIDSAMAPEAASPAEQAPQMVQNPARGPKRMRVEKDRPEQAEGSND